MLARVSFGDFIDRHTILTIKECKVTLPTDATHIAAELEELHQGVEAILRTGNVTGIATALLCINQQLWDLEDEVRRPLGDGALAHKAREIFRLNDSRATLKKQINVVAASPFHEVKLHT